MEKQVERRRNYYIKKEFQRTFILRFCGLVAAGALFFGLIVYLMSLNTVTTTFEDSRLAIKSTADHIAPLLILSSVIVIVGVSIATVVMMLYASHKIAGPLYRIEEYLKDVAAGDLRVSFHLRAGDEIRALASQLDVVAKGLREKIALAQKALDELEEIVEKPHHKSADIKEKVHAIKKMMSVFKT